MSDFIKRIQQDNSHAGIPFWRWKRLTQLIASAMAMILMLSVAMVVLAVQGDGYTLSENYAHGKEVFTSEANGAGAVDGDPLSYWRTASGSEKSSISLIVSLGQKTEINLLNIRVLRPKYMKAVKLQYTTASDPSSTDDWIDIKVYEGDAITSVLTVGFEAVQATAVRFYADLKLKQAGLYEFEVYHTDNVDAAVKKMGEYQYLPYVQSESMNAQIVSVGENGELIYADFDGQGSTLLDYSRVGYRAGEEKIPLAKVVKILEPGNLNDHTAMIRKAIAEVAALPVDQRGAILLRAGTYTVSGQINIASSGIVLRGEGQGENGTIIYDKRTNVGEGSITVAIMGKGSYSSVTGTKRKVQNALVPMGQTTLTLENVGGYAVGDAVRVVCTPNDLWVKVLGMNIIPGNDTVQWKPSAYVMTYEREIVAVDETAGTVTLDTGIPLTLDQTYYSTVVEKIEDSKNRITECGIENIRFLSAYNGNYDDEKHAFTAVKLSNCRNCWVRDVTAKHYAYACVEVSDKSIYVTVEGCSFLEPRSKVTGSRRYSFCLNGGQYTLFRNCYARDSRHDYVVQNQVCGPNVFLDCVADDSNAVSEPHHRWSNGTLYDHVYQIGEAKIKALQAVNRGKSGTGHGWAGVNTVFWNCLSPAIVVRKPQTEQNFAIGVYGIYSAGKSTFLGTYKNYIVPEIEIAPDPETKDYENSPMYGNAYIESPYNPVNPSSLYFAQLSYRLHGDATKNVAPTAPILQYPAADSKSDSYSVLISGTHDLGAERVYVYVDGGRYEAVLAVDGSNQFALTIYLPNGYHELFVTQMVNGMESARGAARTFLIEAQGSYDATAALKPEITLEPDYPIVRDESTPETNTGEPTTDDGVASTDGTEPSEPSDTDDGVVSADGTEPSDTDDNPVKGGDQIDTILIAVGIAVVVCVAVCTGVICARKKKEHV